MDHKTQIQRWLDDLNRGDTTAWQRLLPLVYEPLRQQAHAVFRNERNTLQATALLHEALIGLQMDLDELEFEGPGRFFALASRMMRNKLLDHVRERNAEKRGGGRTIVSLDPSRDEIPAGLRSFDLVDMNETLEQLREHDERHWTLTELKFFCGMTNKEVAEALGIAVKTVEGDWTFIKAWLGQRLDAYRETR